MSIDQSAYPDWMWDGSLTDSEIRERLGWPAPAEASEVEGSDRG